MLYIHNFENYNSENIIKNLEKYMLESLNQTNIFLSNNNNNNNINNNNNNFIVTESNNSRRNIFVDYNKYKSKYNENIYKKKYKDKIFWTFYKILKNLDDLDIENLNHFQIESKSKIEFVEKLRLNKSILKKNKIKITLIEENLVDKNPLTLYTLNGLCLLYNINIIIVKDNKIFTIFSNKDIDEENLKLSDITNFTILNIDYNNSIISNNYNITIINEINQKFFESLKTKYYVKNLNKPLKSISSYKSDELINIANKLNINVYSNIVNKKKTKKDLYEEIVKILS
jgi:hypothetical protein